MVRPPRIKNILTSIIKKIKFDDKKNMNKKFINISFILGAVLAICHVSQFVGGDHSAAVCIRIALCIAYIPAGMIWREKVLPVIFPIFAYAILIFNGYNNYTSFFILIFSMQIKPKWGKIYLSMYAFAVTLALVLHDLGADHAIIHVLNCLFIYAVYKILFPQKEKKKLDLQPDELQILQEWAQVRELKAVRCFSHNTVFEKLRAARIRNECTSNDELLQKYIEEHTDQYVAGSK